MWGAFDYETFETVVEWDLTLTSTHSPTKYTVDNVVNMSTQLMTYLPSLSAKYITFCIFEVDCYFFANQDFNKINFSAPLRFFFRTVHPAAPAYALLITDQAIVNGSDLEFFHTNSTNPAIIQLSFFTKMPASPISFSSDMIPPFNLSSNGTLSIYILALQYERWLINYYNESYENFLIPGNSTDTSDNYIKSLDYSTLATKKLYNYQGEGDAMCTIQVRFTGILRGLYINNDFILSGASVDISTEETLKSQVKLKARSTFFVHLIGYKWTSLPTVDIFDCKNLTETETSSSFSVFQLQKMEHQLETIQDTNDTYCPSNCLTCHNYDYCIRCHQGYYLYNGTCNLLCPDTTFLYPARDHFCDSQIRPVGVRLATPIFDTESKLSNFEYLIDNYYRPNFTITTYYPYYPKYSNIPKIYPNSTNASLFESKHILTNFTSVTMDPTNTNPVYEIISNEVLEFIEISLNLNISFFTYKVAPAKFFVVTLSSSDPEIGQAKSFLSTFEDLVVSSSSKYNIFFYLDCSDLCSIAITFSGDVRVMKNDVIQLLTDSSSTSKSTLIPDPMTGLNYIDIRLENSNLFSVQFTGSYEIYAPEIMLFDDYFEAEFQCDTYCENCTNSTFCHQCVPGFKLLENATCFLECVPGQVNLNQTICAEVCGDGIRSTLVGPNYCDDNNTVSGDGCSSECEIEYDYVCRFGGPNSSDICNFRSRIRSITQDKDNTRKFIVEFNVPIYVEEDLEIGRAHV